MKAFFLLPSVARTVTVAFPAFFAVILPLELTEATAVLEDLYFNFFMLAFFGVMVGLIVRVSPVFRVSCLEPAVSFLISRGFFTVTLQVDFMLLFPFTLAVIVTVPALTPFTTPLLFTAATFLSELFQVILAEEAFGAFVTLSAFLIPTYTVAFWEG